MRFSSALIVTVRNDAEALKNLQKDVENQSAPFQEICLAIADSTDSTLAVAENWAKKNSSVRVLRVGQANRAEARNQAVLATKSTILVFTDAGCRFGENWHEHMITPLLQKKTKLVSGVTLGSPENPWEAAQIPFVLVLPQDLQPDQLPATRAMAVWRKSFLEIGLFRSDVAKAAEDYEWSRRSQKLGVRSWLAKKAVVIWRPRATPSSFWRMMYGHAFGDMQAQAWRIGHLTLLLRYLIFIAMSIWSLPFGAVLWSLYILVKSFRLSERAYTSFPQTVAAQVLSDTAVLSGIILGFCTTLLSTGMRSPKESA